MSGKKQYDVKLNSLILPNRTQVLYDPQIDLPDDFDNRMLDLCDTVKEKLGERPFRIFVNSHHDRPQEMHAVKMTFYGGQQNRETLNKNTVGNTVTIKKKKPEREYF